MAAHSSTGQMAAVTGLQQTSRPASADCVPLCRMGKHGLSALQKHPLQVATGRLQPCRRQTLVCTAAFAQQEKASTVSAAPQSKLQSQAEVVQLYRYPGLSESALKTLRTKAAKKVSPKIDSIDAEQCYNIALSEPLTAKEAATLTWLLQETFEPEMLTPDSRFDAGSSGAAVVEVGPRMSFSTAWSANAVSICHSCGLHKVTRMEVSRRYQLRCGSPLSGTEAAAFAALVHDRMTEEVYAAPLTSFATDTVPGRVYTVPVMERGRAALEEISEEIGLAFDEQDLEYYTTMFQQQLRRDPTNVELFDIAQSNSEHSRHWFFQGDIWVDGQKMPETLMQLVKSTLKAHPNNSVIGFKDNSSAIRGTEVTPVLPHTCGAPSPLAPQPRDWDILLTAETHNFPCAVAPYPGAETGTGGRIRDTHATGTGSIMGVATAGYCTGNLHLDGYSLPWEDPGFEYPPNLASPEQILIDASNGASDYGNKFGEPLVAGYTRTFGLRLPNGERREWIKPIMFSGGLGQIDHQHLRKLDPEIGMLIVKIGGPAYRIGMGGGAASSVPSGSLAADLDFNAVQRGDAEMAQKLWRVVRACVELGERNPIQQIHDQGAGGNCNVVKEIIYPLGAHIDVRAVKLGDETMSVLEIWGAEYQENDALLIKPQDRGLLESVCERERCTMQVLGTVDGCGRIVLMDREAAPQEPTPVDLDLEQVLGDLPRKTFKFDRITPPLLPIHFPEGTTVMTALERVLRLPAVGSKRFLTSKVDRCVTGLVAQQQCVGPLQLPLADVAVAAQSHLNLTGAATSIGEQPYKGLIAPGPMARLALGEALTNLVWARVTALSDIKASVNWMYAAKMEGEGAAVYDAALALKEAMLELEVACDGGKDSLSMAAAAGGETVKAPGNLVISAYCTCPDISATVTPDLKLPGAGRLLHVDLGQAHRRLGGSALAQAYSQIGDVSPDVDPAQLKAAFNTTQRLIEQRLVSAGHDISDGGIVVALLEMAFAGNTGVQVDLPLSPLAEGSTMNPAFPTLFAEELGLLLEVAPQHEVAVLEAYLQAGLPAALIGTVSSDMAVDIKVAGRTAVSGTTPELRGVWEETAFQLERLQAAEETVAQEQAGQAARVAPAWHLPFTPAFTPADKLTASDKVRVAVIREEGSNGDREMAAAVWLAGMEPWDITMSDLLNARASLDSFQGICFVGGFSYADVLDSAKGWAGTIRCNPRLWAQFQAFYARDDTFALGVCNGCQLMALLGWVPATQGLLPDTAQPRFVHNASTRFESRWTQVRISGGSPSIFTRGMADAVVGIWCAHGEGRLIFPDDTIREKVTQQHLAPIRYCDSSGQVTQQYPANPNGSTEGIAALCSPNGRFMAMMPHPERCFLMWQNPWYPQDSGLKPDGPSPWLQLFQNARLWCESLDS